MNEERMLFVLDGLDAEAAAELARTTPPGIRAKQTTARTYSSESIELACVIVFATIKIAGTESVKIVTKWLMDGLRGLAGRRVNDRAPVPFQITINRREIDYKEGAVRRVVEEHIRVESASKEDGDR